jgi:hypothetical protein
MEESCYAMKHGPNTSGTKAAVNDLIFLMVAVGTLPKTLRYKPNGTRQISRRRKEFTTLKSKCLKILHTASLVT